jgi:hypothetical protein
MKATLWAICLITTALASPVNAQVLEMPEEAPMPEPEAVEPAPESGTFTVTLPGRGMTKDQVEERFGSPPEKVGAVGEPPISRWVYSGFTVYFEYDHVIHAVNHH